MFLSRQSIKIIKELMRRGETTQFELSKSTGVSIGQVNKTVTKLKHAFLANTDPKRGTKLVDEERLLLAIGAESPIQASLKTMFYTPADKDEAMKKISRTLQTNNYAFTLLSAIPEYSAYAEGETISIYADQNEMREVLGRLGKLKAKNGVPVEVFEANDGILADKKKKKNGNFVSNEQLIIDLHRTPQLVYLGSQLLREYRKAHRHG